MRSPWRPLAIASLIMVVAGGVVSAADGTSGHDREAAKRPVSSPRELSASEAATLAYWTPQRMANAIPAEAERKRPVARVEEQSSNMQRDGVSIAGVDVPNDQEGRVVMAAQSQPAAEYPYPFGRRSVEKQLRKVSPYKTVGRVFYRQGGVNYVCSGASVVSKPNNVVFTAGHCLNDGAGTWSKDVVFVPGFVSHVVLKGLRARGLDGLFVVSYSQWESNEAFEAYRDQPAEQWPEGRAKAVGRVRGVATSADVNTYRVAHTRSAGE